jgi:hypothetical protein
MESLLLPQRLLDFQLKNATVDGSLVLKFRLERFYRRSALVTLSVPTRLEDLARSMSKPFTQQQF